MFKMNHFFWITVCFLLGSVHACKRRLPRRKFTNTTFLPSETFTTGIYLEMADDKTGENFILSPFSIAIILSMVHLAANGNSAKQLEDILGIPSLEDDTIHETNEKYLKLPRLQNEFFTLKSANRLYVNKNIPVDEIYKIKLNRFYLTGIESFDFRRRADTANSINQWVEQYTNGKIRNLISGNSLTPSTLLVLVNAIYFKGTWKDRFNKWSTKRRDFFLEANHTVQCETMHGLIELLHKSDTDFDCKIIKLPYKGQQQSMFIVLPNQIDGLDSLEQKLNPEFFENLIQEKGFTRDEMNVYLPKFRLESQFDLKNILFKMGLTDIFDIDKSDLSGMIRGDMKVMVSKIIHKTFVEINEEGTEAAAATTGIIMVTSQLPDDERIIRMFKADHPFLFCIVDHRMKKILFIGRLKNPGLN